MKQVFFYSTRVFKVAAVIYTLLLATIILLNDAPQTSHLFHVFATVRNLDKLGHLLLMGFLSFIFNVALGARSIKIMRFRYLLGSIVVFTITTLEEFSQIFVVSRTFDFSDLFFNVIGILCFGEIARMFVQTAAHYERALQIDR